MNETRVKRVRDLVHRMNKERRRQALKIDILCNDMVSAHRDFVKQLTNLNLAVRFYECAVAQHDLPGLIDCAIEMISSQIEEPKVSIFLLSGQSFDIHTVDADGHADYEQANLENYFTADVVGEISRSVQVCTLDDMCRAGLQASPVVLKSVSAAAIPVGSVGDPIGFVLIQRSANNKLRFEEIESVTGISNALCSVIKSLRSRHQTI